MFILFVDDDSDDYELFCEALKSFNKTAKCLHAIDGQEAIDLLENVLTVLPDYILLDVNMPKMGGKKCLTKIKTNRKLKDIPVIVYSTTADLREIQTYKDLGAKDFIVKPGRFNELLETFREALK